MSTAYHAKYLAYELTKRCSSEKLGKLAQSLFDATVDLNPHQIDAALFAFRSPLSRGAILADEVGLGKTIEAGLVLSQVWAERNRRILITLPAALREQWRRELAEKFHLFNGVFDASDEVLGALESGVDFEKRINDIYRSCRTPEDISGAFDQLQLELDEQIQEQMQDTRSKLLENFDEEVRARLKQSLGVKPLFAVRWFVV